MRAWEISDKWGVYGAPKNSRPNTDGSSSPLTFQGDDKWKNEPDYMKKWFSRPYLTGGVKGNYMLPVKKKKGK